MKALSIRQPWAHLIVSGIKDIENRSWKTNYRGRIFVHASKQTAFAKDPIVGFLYTYWKHIPQDIKAELLDGIYQTAAIIGEVDVIDCVQNHQSRWADKGAWNWVLANPIKYDKPFLGIKGGLSLWTL